MSETEKKELGTCPVCGKGQIIKGGVGYICTHSSNEENKCDFVIYAKSYDKDITDEIVIQLIEKKETEVFQDFHTKDGNTFSASLKVEDGKVQVHFVNEVLNTPCPRCGGKIEKHAKGYACENYLKKDAEEKRQCQVYIPQTICEIEIPVEEVETLLKGNQTSLITGFKRKDGGEFESHLVLSQDLKVEFNNDLCKCPKCGTGLIRINPKSYGCSNYKDEAIKCDFTIWKETFGRKISEEEAAALCQNKETGFFDDFHKKDGSAMKGKLVIAEDFKVKFEESKGE